MSNKYRISNIGGMATQYPKPNIYMVEKKIYQLKYLFYYWKAVDIFHTIEEAKKFCETNDKTVNYTHTLKQNEI